jgi:hypothetical protein
LFSLQNGLLELFEARFERDQWLLKDASHVPRRFSLRQNFAATVTLAKTMQDLDQLALYQSQAKIKQSQRVNSPIE